MATKAKAKAIVSAEERAAAMLASYKYGTSDRCKVCDVPELKAAVDVIVGVAERAGRQVSLAAVCAFVLSETERDLSIGALHNHMRKHEPRWERVSGLRLRRGK